MRIWDPWKAFYAVLAVCPEPGPGSFSWPVFADGTSVVPKTTDSRSFCPQCTASLAHGEMSRDQHRVMGLRVAPCSTEVPGSSLRHGRSPRASASPRQPGRTNLLLTPHAAAG